MMRALSAGVTSIMNIATDLPALEGGWKLQSNSGHLSLFCAAATTPHDLTGSDDPFFSIVKDAVYQKRLSAIGETGFDFFYNPDNKEAQEAVFLRYALLAKETGLPLIVHCRNAFPTLLPIIRELGPSLRGILHCFTGTKDDAKALLDLGWYISLSGIVTFPKSESLRETVRFLPNDQFLVETDSPYLAPQPKRGQRNEPSYLQYIVETIASIKKTSYEEIASISFSNACTVFSPSVS